LPLVAQLLLKKNDAIPQDNYRTLHANLLRWVDAASPDLASALHDRPIHKPFTLSAIAKDRDGAWHWRVSVLDDRLWPILEKGGRSLGALDLNGRTVPVRWSAMRVYRRSYERLIAEAEADTYVWMRFVSPTTFRQGALDMPLPEPMTVFRSWLSRWNDFAPPARHMSEHLLDRVYERVAVAEIREFHTRPHDLGYSRPIGFVGRVTYAITDHHTLDPDLVRRINALADYAQFCGTGRKTTYGMGQTRRLPAQSRR
jgi:CRISPR-associated endoribonuclease Cas6